MLEKNKSLELFDLRYPQETFTKNFIPKNLGKTDEESIKQILSGNKYSAKNVYLFSNSQLAIQSVLNALKCDIKNTLSIGANVFECLPSIRCTTSNMDEWEESSFKNMKLIIWSHPNLHSGEYLPQVFFQRALLKLRKLAPSAYILMDQRSHSVCWEELGPGLWDKIKDQDNRVIVLDSTEPVLAPSKFKQITWVKTKGLNLNQSHFHSEEDLAKVFYIVASYKSMQGAFSEELHRKTLVARESLKRIANEVVKTAADVKHWPSCGYFLRLDFDSQLSAKRHFKLFEAHNIKTLEGVRYGQNSSLYLCYGMHLSQIDRLLKSLDIMNKTRI